MQGKDMHLPVLLDIKAMRLVLHGGSERGVEGSLLVLWWVAEEAAKGTDACAPH